MLWSSVVIKYNIIEYSLDTMLILYDVYYEDVGKM